jgi:hypothetical protein
VTGLPPNTQLIARGDLDELVRAVDLLAGQRAWDELVGLRDGCRTAAQDVGRQLWGVAHYADYRLALDAPGSLAASVVVAGSGRFTLGPLTEVVAQHHTFDDLAPHLDSTVAAHVAQERILRGEELTDDRRAALDELGLPGVLHPFEPRYPLPTYRPAERLDGDPPPGAGGSIVSTDGHGHTVTDPTGPAPDSAAADGRSGDVPGRTAGALSALAAPWRDESTGEVRVAAAAAAADAIRAVGGEPDGRIPLTVPGALAAMAFVAASGGVYGRRRGGSAGRAAAWWVGISATGVPFPPDPDELEYGLESLTWWTFPSARTTPAGWELRLAVAGPGWAAAVAAYDAGGNRSADGGPGGGGAA